MRPQDPERLYTTFINHTLTCRQCGPAGGEGAAEKDLCPDGKALLMAWGNGERFYAREQYGIDNG